MYAPYTECEWNYITYDSKQARKIAVQEHERTKYKMMIEDMKKQYICISKDKLILTVMSILPTVMLVVFGVSLISK